MSKYVNGVGEEDMFWGIRKIASFNTELDTEISVLGPGVNDGNERSTYTTEFEDIRSKTNGEGVQEGRESGMVAMSGENHEVGMETEVRVYNITLKGTNERLTPEDNHPVKKKKIYNPKKG